ncbi:Uma2 family endonuclease [Streptomyces sp. NPDC057137]|uniref:Uma2 family endonuclease n=1 Tax=Streptomyces sp. NPDC057137 TaxID=3346030 RepID=UPI00362957B3
MSAAAAEHPWDSSQESQLKTADSLMEQLPGFRVEIIGGVITVAPPPDGNHASVLTDVMIPFLAVGVHGQESRVLQNVGLWLPGGPEDFAIPDLAVVDADFEDHLVQYNCYDPAVFRLVLEVTSSNYQQDLRNKVTAYAEAGIPIYVIVDRKHNRLHVLTEPVAGDYTSHRIHAPGEQILLPDTVGAEVKLDVSALLRDRGPKMAT